ncbi:MAG: 50S ribosomal protein L22 [Candidatus Saccharibacteria bacterium]|jgi:large subunit ribosomal protein L22|nr:50S ribosomal protein L22 [Patescibacteria group bacterium]
MKVQAKARNLSISAQKLRLSANGLRGSSVQDALQHLASRPQKGSAMVFDALRSAIANAEHNNSLKSAQLTIDEIRVDQGAKLKRWRPRSKGMTAPIVHPKAHLTIVLTDQVVTKVKKEAK